MATHALACADSDTECEKTPARRLRGLAHVSEKESANAAHHCRQNVKELAALHRSLEAAVDAFEAAARAETEADDVWADAGAPGLAPATEHDRIQILQ